MIKNIKKYSLILTIVLCVSGIILSIYMGLWLINKQNWFGFKFVGISQNATKTKYQSWASKVVIDPLKLYKVVNVVDGDTIKVSVDNHDITIRLLGINTPEVLDPRKPVECYGPEASAETKRLLDGGSVYLSLNPNYEKIDKYGRLLAYVTLNGQSHESLFINEYLIEQGYAREYTFDIDKPYQYRSRFIEDEISAKKLKKGLWGKC